MSGSDPENIETPQAEGADFLNGQAEIAKAALGKVLRDAQVALAEGVDPKEWARKYPLVTVGAALAAGFAGIYLAVPSKEEQELRKLERIRKALAPEPVHHTNGSSDGDKPAAAKPTIWAGLLKEVLSALRPILTGIVTAQMAAHREAQTAPADPTTSQN